MGMTTSSLDLPPAEDYLTQVCLALRECSSLRLIHAPKELIEVVQRAVEKHWSPGYFAVLYIDSTLYTALYIDCTLDLQHLRYSARWIYSTFDFLHFGFQ